MKSDLSVLYIDARLRDILKIRAAQEKMCLKELVDKIIKAYLVTTTTDNR